jgi:hypothetical protein
MDASRSPRPAASEIRRWGADPILLVVVLALALVSAALTYLAVTVAAGGASSGGGGVQIETDTVLTSSSTDDDLASMARSSLTMLVPIAAVVLGVRFAGGEMTSGALLQIAVAARWLRVVFAVRAAMVAAVGALAGAVTAVATIAGVGAAVAGRADLTQLDAWASAASIVGGAAAQGALLGLLAFALSAVTRRWIVVLVVMVVYLVVIEPVLAGILDTAGSWLPRAATSELMATSPDAAHAVPTLIAAVGITAVAVLSLRRGRVVR